MPDRLLFLSPCRKFLYKHLAQIKYILPESLKIDKVLVHDKKTLCMRPDLKVTLLFNAVEVPPQKSGFTMLRELFISRLEDFASEHPEVTGSTFYCIRA